MSYTIDISNCNSIERAQISLATGSLNIKYGPNGIGKSTISRALTLNAAGGEGLESLRPFKYRAGDGHPAPKVSGADAIKDVLVFDESYVSQFTFQRDEVLKDSFEIFINTDEYQQGLDQIASMFKQLEEAFADQPEFEQALSDFSELRDAFEVTKTGSLSKKSRGTRALKVGGKLKEVPAHLHGYSNFILGLNPAAWVTWQSKGHIFLEESDHCPFCSTPSIDKVTVRQVAEEYESAAVKTMSALRDTIDRLGTYFNQKDLETLQEITSLLTEPTQDQDQFLVDLHRQVARFLEHLRRLRQLSFHTFDDVEHVDEVLRELQIDLRLFSSLDSDATQSVVGSINEKLGEVATHVGEIKGHIGRHKAFVASLIRRNQDAINQFLDSAGYRYKVRIQSDANSYRMILEHLDAPGHVESAGGHLSYGERNAFALVLFMHQVMRTRPDLVVLDDPVSSFDKTKKFAILHRLFNGPDSIRNFTTLLLTHDLEPAIDVVRGVANRFEAANAVVHFLSGNAGIVSEKLIRAEDISTFSEVCKTNITASSDELLTCIYMRRLFESQSERGLAYELLSSLLHLRDIPSRFGPVRGQFEPLAPSEVASATVDVQRHMPGFDYARIVRDAKDPAGLRDRFHRTSVGYEKVQLYRVFVESIGDKVRSIDAVTKFVNESFHIENEYVMQLNPREYDTVPHYIVSACSELIDAHFADL